MPYKAKWLEFNQAVDLIVGRENRAGELGAVAEELVDAIRDNSVHVKWPIADAAPPTDWRWFGPILGTGRFKEVLVCRTDIERRWRPAQRKTGPKPKLRTAIANKMFDDFRSGRRTQEQLTSDTLDALAAEYGGSRGTARLAREDALARLATQNNPEQL